MSVEDFERDVFVIKLNASPTNQGLGSYQIDTPMELGDVDAYIHTVGTPGGTERFRLNLYGSAQQETPIAQSDWIDLASFAAATTQDGFNKIRFTFPDRPHVHTEYPYYFAIETENYAPVGDTDWFGVGLDWPYPTNTQDTAGRASAQLQLWGYR